MILYHISKRLLKNEEFIPRIPENRVEDENSSIERVCFADSLEGCLMAIPTNGNIDEDLMEEQNGVVKVFEIDTEDFLDEFIVNPETLQNKQLVSDAILTGEHWITTSFVAKRSYFIQIQSMDFSEITCNVLWGEGTLEVSSPMVKNLNFVSTEEEMVEVKLPDLSLEESTLFNSVAEEIIGFNLYEKSRVKVGINKEMFFMLVAYAATAFETPDIFLGGNPKHFANFGSTFILFNERIIYQEY